MNDLNPEDGHSMSTPGEIIVLDDGSTYSGIEGHIVYRGQVFKVDLLMEYLFKHLSEDKIKEMLKASNPNNEQVWIDDDTNEAVVVYQKLEDIKED